MVKLTKSQIDERWELVDPAHLNTNAQGSLWGELYRFPRYVGVAPGECVATGFGDTIQAPSAPGTYTLWQYVQDACDMGSEWEREQPPTAPSAERGTTERSKIMKIWINDNISVETVTAVPCIKGEYDEENRQPALYIVERGDIEARETVIFGGYAAPTTVEELEHLWRKIDWYEAETDYETLETIRR